MPYAIDLFCGAGGMSEGLIQAGFHILFSSDINEDVQRTYMNRHEQLGLRQGINTYYHRGDIKDLTGAFIKESIKHLKIFRNKDLPNGIDAIFGGPPCQGFSRAGRRNANDPRNMLFKEYLRVVKEINPKYVVMENVVGFLDTKFFDFVGLTGKKYADGMLVPQILANEFELIGYHALEPKVLDAADYGVPQRRNRVIFIAYRDGEKKPDYPKPVMAEENRITIQDAISDLIRDENVKTKVSRGGYSQYQMDSIMGRTPDVNGNSVSSNGKIYNNETSTHQPLIIERFSLFREGEDGVDIRNRVATDGIDIKSKKNLILHCSNVLDMDEEEIVRRFMTADVSEKMLDALLTKKNIRSRLDRAKPSATIMTIQDDYISPFEARAFTVRESARLQSFDDSFVFLGKRTTGGDRRKIEVPQYSQVGNAVPPLMAKAIAKQIIKVLRCEEKEYELS